MAWALCCVGFWPGQEVFGLGNEVAGDHLLRIYDSQQLGDGRLVEDEILIFRDGVTVLLRNVGRQSRVFRADARPESIEELKKALVAAEVDTLTGDCNLGDAPRVLGGPLGLRSRTTWLSWFGIAGRRSRHLALGHGEPGGAPFDAACAEPVERVASAAFGFAQTVLSGLSVTKDPDDNYPQSLLFSILNDLDSDPACTSYTFNEDSYLFRDGLLLHHVLDSDGNFAYTRAQVPRETRQALGSVLAEERIGSIDANCRTWFFLPFAVDGACRRYRWQSEAIWHGREGRQGRIAGSSEARLQCSAPVARVRMELVRLLLTAATDPAAVVVRGAFGAP